MPAGTDLIFFDDSEDWRSVANVTREARLIATDRYAPIGSFDLGVELNTGYIAVVAGTTKGKDRWFFAGDITQVYKFPVAPANPVLGQIKPQGTRLAINRLQLIETERVSTDNFRLQYTPPYWFRDCTIRVYSYVGDKINFVEDTLFDIGNALGTDPNTEGTALDIQFDLLEVLISEKFNQLRLENEQFQLANVQDRLDILDQIGQLDAGIYTLAEGLADLLPNDRGSEIRQNAKNRLDLDLGFL